MAAKNLTGARYGRLVATHRTGTRSTQALWSCTCDCGNVVQTTASHLNSGKTRSCGCLRKRPGVELTGNKCGLLTVESRAAAANFWNCVCECGTRRVISASHLTTGHTKSCGCIKGKANATHRMRGTPTHNSWCAMKQRCNYKKSRVYEAYGGRGITVCEGWNNSFAAFLADMGERPSNTTLDRYPDTNGNYEPGNCRWAPEAEQARNRRSTIMIERNGVTKCVKDWCEELGIKPDVVYSRIRRGMSPKEALP